MTHIHAGRARYLRLAHKEWDPQAGVSRTKVPRMQQLGLAEDMHGSWVVPGRRLGWFEPERVGDLLPVDFLCLLVPGDAPASVGPVGGYLSVVEPVVDGVGGDAEFGGGVFDADFAVLDGDGACTPNF